MALPTIIRYEQHRTAEEVLKLFEITPDALAEPFFDMGDGTG